MQRYELNGGAIALELKPGTGEWVKYADHAAAVARLERERDAFKEDIRVVKYALGERYSPVPHIGDQVGDVVRALATARAEAERYRASLERIAANGCSRIPRLAHQTCISIGGPEEYWCSQCIARAALGEKG